MNPPKNVTNAVIAERVDNLQKNFDDFKEDMKGDVDNLDGKIDKLIEMTSIAKEANERSKKNETAIAEVKDIARSNKQVIDRINKWAIAIGTPLTISFILALLGVLWGFLSHDIAIVKIVPTAIPTIIATIMP